VERLMRRDADWQAKMEEAFRNADLGKPGVGPVIDTGKPWGHFREERGDPPALTHDQWIARMHRAMYNDAGIPGRGWTHRVLID
jgi:hypothetical protein